MSNWINGKVVENVRWHERLFSLRVNAELSPFSAGQFTKLGLVVDGKRLARAYSFVNSPAQDVHEFYYVTVQDGGLSPLLAQLQPGDEILLSDPASGFFTLDDVPTGKELWLLSTGTAIGPYLSMLYTPQLLARFESIVLVHCVRPQQDLSYQQTIAQLMQQYGTRLRYIPIVTRGDNKDILSQRIPLAISNGALSEQVSTPLTANSSQVMICGNPEMVRETKATLLDMGFTKNLRRAPGNITVENYW